jgi:hypothetical protein
VPWFDVSRRIFVATVRIVHVVPRPGPHPDGTVRIGQFVIVLADADAKAADTETAVGRRALLLLLQVPGGHSLWQLLERPAADPVMAGVLEETAARLLGAAGVSVTGVELQVTDPDALELHSANVTTSIELGTAGGTRHVALSAGYGLALAAASGAPVRVADTVMDRLAVALADDDALAPFIPVAAAQQPARRAQRWRFEPRNLAFTDGLDRWELHGDAGRAHLQDYSCVTGRRSVTLACTVPEPHGCAVLVQTVFADDYRGRTVTFHGELRTQDVTGHAGLHLATGRPDEPPGAHLYRRGTSDLTASGSSDWTRHEVAAQVPGDAEVVRFGLSLTGCGYVELRNAELSAGA